MSRGKKFDPQPDLGKLLTRRSTHPGGQQPPHPWSSGLVLPLVALALIGLAILGGCVLFIVEPSTEMAWDNPNGGILRAFVFISLVGLVLLLFGIFLGRRASTYPDTKEIIREPVQSGSRIHGYLVDQAESHNVAGRDFQVIYSQPVPPKHKKRGRSSSLNIRVSTQVPSSLQFVKESSFDRFCKRFGLANEHVTGDTEFDDLVYVHCRSDGYAVVYLKDMHKRQAIRELLESGFAAVHLNPQEVTATWPDFNPAMHHQTDLGVHAAKCLMTLADELPQWTPQQFSIWKDERFTKNALMGCLLVALLATFICEVRYTPVRFVPQIPAGILLFPPVYIIFGLFSAWMLRGRSTSHSEWYAVVGMALLTLLPTCTFGIAAFNGLCDRSAIEPKTASIASKSKTPGKSGTSYWVEIADWKYSGVITFKVNESEYDSASRAELEIGRGALGIEWLKTKRFLP